MLVNKILQVGALLPPKLKTHFVSKVMSRCYHQWSDNSVARKWTTNLGIDRDLRINFNSPIPPFYLFGAPDQYKGERGCLYLARHLSRLSDAFIDIGAHHGYFLFFVYDSRRKNFPIYYLEPNPALFEEIQGNIKVNGLTNISGFPMGVSGRSGDGVFYVDLSDDIMSSINPNSFGERPTKKILIKQVTFDDFARDHDLSNVCMKVDIENAEFDFLEGAIAERSRISYLIMEVLGPAIEKGFLREASKRLGMQAYYINDLTLESCPDGKFRYVPPQYNWLFCRESQAELETLLKGSGLSVRA